LFYFEGGGGSLLGFLLGHTSHVHDVVVVHAACFGERGEQTANRVQGMTHPALQVGGGRHAPLEELWARREKVLHFKTLTTKQLQHYARVCVCVLPFFWCL